MIDTYKAEKKEADVLKRKVNSKCDVHAPHYIPWLPLKGDIQLFGRETRPFELFLKYCVTQNLIQIGSISICLSSDLLGNG